MPGPLDLLDQSVSHHNIIPASSGTESEIPEEARTRSLIQLLFSALATLWHVNDPVSSRLVGEFYRELGKAAVSRDLALQRAQLKILGDSRYEHPGYWAPFLLINNWL